MLTTHFLHGVLLTVSYVIVVFRRRVLMYFIVVLLYTVSLTLVISGALTQTPLVQFVVDLLLHCNRYHSQAFVISRDDCPIRAGLVLDC